MIQVAASTTRLARLGVTTWIPMAPTPVLIRRTVYQTNAYG
jgi:hypothetical protein